MAYIWTRKLGLGLAMIMTITQMNGITVLAAPEEESDEAEIGEEEYDAPELLNGVSVTAVGATKVTPHFNETFTLKVQVANDDNASYTYEWYKDFYANNNKLNNNTDTLTVSEGISAKRQAYFFCVFEEGNTNPISKTTFTVIPTNDLEAHIKGDPNSRSTSLTLPYGASVTLSVEASAYDESNMMYTWCNKEIRNLAEGAKACDFTIDQITKNDTYTCVVKDGFSSSGVNVDFIISIDNKFLAYPEGESQTETTKIISAPKGNDVTLKVIASCADNSLGFSWGAKGARQSQYTTVIGENKDSLTVKVTDDEMYYRCSVYDQFQNNRQIIFRVKTDGSSNSVNKDNQAAATVDAAIEAIGTVAYTTDCKTKIDTARAAYENLTSEQKLLVTNTETLIAAETAYANLKAAAEKNTADLEAANTVSDKIDAIGTVTYSDTCKQKIDAARASYNNLTDAQKALVSNYSVLTSAEDEYATQKNNAEQLENSRSAAKAVETLITGIGTVTYTDSCKAKIESARNAYNNLSTLEKAMVSNTDTLTAAEKTYAGLKSAAEQNSADFEAAKSAADKINVIGTVDYTDECKGRIDAARASYEKLTDTQKSLVANLNLLTSAEIKYAALKTAAEQEGTDQAAAAAVEILIADIGTVSYTEICKTKIDTAISAYEALTETQKQLVSNSDTLTVAEAEYASLKVAAEQEMADKIAADMVTEKIAAIGSVSYSDTSKAKIDAAQTAYNALTSSQKQLVSNTDTLTAAEAKYKALKAAAEQDAEDQASAKAVIDKIADIGTVTFSVESKEKIDEARSAYAKLNDYQKSLVNNYDSLVTAEKTYEELLSAEIKNSDDLAAANTVKDKIEAIGSVSYSEDCLAKIDAARTNYEKLTDTQKKLVGNYSALLSAEREYEVLEEEAKKKETDLKVAKVVSELIDGIGEVTYSNESKGKIDAARSAYELLTEDQKALVNNLEILTDAEKTYEALMNTAIISSEDAGAAQAVIEKINSIGEVDTTDECKERITVAREAYEKLTEDQKMLVMNYSLLTAAESLYNVLINTSEKPDSEAENTLVKQADGSRVYCKNGEEQRNYTGLVSVDGIWYYIVNGVVDDAKIGFVDYEDAIFAVVYGVLETNANGLVQDPEHLEDWYFCANGQVQSQYTGLAFYDGEWFYINQGKLDTNLADYIEYDGGLFFVAAGRIMKEVNGLAKDPNGIDWYYLANGQAQTQYTGLAFYDGEWFYVIDGKLAENYSGTVSYDGAMFNVVNGMVK